ncbi:MAG: hypothetical protein J5691_08105 [Bacilli bacterium]|nr:hypothetical protein [Bacilli bacterium]
MDNLYLDRGKEVLKILISNGYEAYFIGGVVRSAILGVDCDLIDITTSATPDAARVIFSSCEVTDYKPGSIKLIYADYPFILSTFRNEEYSDRRTPIRYHYSKSLLEDLSRRDYTMNAIAMNHNSKLTDAYDGFGDIKNGRIRPIGKAKTRFKEDPIRILRGIRFVSELDFNLVKGVSSAMKSCAKLLNRVDLKDICYELKKIINGQAAKKAVKLLVSTNVYKYLPSLRKGCVKLAKKYAKIDYEEFLLLCFVLNDNLNEDYLDYVDNIEMFKKTYNLILTNPKCKFDTLTLFSYGLDSCLSAHKINRLLGKSHSSDKNIRRAYNALIIKKTCDLEFKGEDILEICKGQSAQYIQVLVDNIIYKVLTREIPNEYGAIKAYCLSELEQNGFTEYDSKDDYLYHDGIVGKRSEDINEDMLVDVNELNRVLDGPVVNTPDNIAPASPVYSEIEKEPSSPIEKDLTDHRIDMLEKRLNEQEQQIHEKDAQLEELLKESRQTKIKKDVDQMVKGNMDLINDMDFVDVSDEEKQELSRKIKKLYIDFINNSGSEDDEN